MRDWYIFVGGREIGPFSTQDAIHFLQRRDISQIYVWSEGFSDWQLANEVRELQRPKPPPEAPTHRGVQLDPKTRKVRWGRIGAIIGIALSIVGAVTEAAPFDGAYFIGRLIGGGAGGLFLGFVTGVLVDLTRRTRPNAGPKPDAVRTRGESNFIVRHWRGELPLGCRTGLSLSSAT